MNALSHRASLARTGPLWATVSACALLAFITGSVVRAQSLAERLKNVQTGHEGPGIKVKLPAWKPVSTATSNQKIPLAPGLTVVTAVNDASGDYESIKILQTVSPAKVILN